VSARVEHDAAVRKPRSVVDVGRVDLILQRKSSNEVFFTVIQSVPLI